MPRTIEQPKVGDTLTIGDVTVRILEIRGDEVVLRIVVPDGVSVRIEEGERE